MKVPDGAGGAAFRGSRTSVSFLRCRPVSSPPLTGHAGEGKSVAGPERADKQKELSRLSEGAEPQVINQSGEKQPVVDLTST